jgi:hypothetical protein
MARRPSAKAKPENRGATAQAGSRPGRERWKHFFFEFLSVTLGVLLALVLEQAATRWRERERVADLRASMNGEIGDADDVFLLRARLSPCVKRKLEALDTFLRAGGPAAPVSNVGRPNFFFTSRGGWNSDASDQLARYLGADRFKTYGEYYQGMAQYETISAEEQDDWAVLQTLEGDPDPLTADRRARLREAAALARNKNLLLTAIAKDMLILSRKIGVKPSRVMPRVEVETAPLCKPLRAA